MTKFLALTLLLSAASAAAQDTAVSTSSVQASSAAVQLSTEPVAAPLPDWRRPALTRLSAELDRLARVGGNLPPENLDAIAAEAVALRGRVREALGKELLEAAERGEAPLRAGEALAALAAFRSALQAAYAAGGGKYPASPAELVPGRLPAVPELYLPDHEPSGAVTLIVSKKHDTDVSKAVTDSGGWLYFADPDSDNYGLLLIDCGHLHPAGGEFYKY